MSKRTGSTAIGVLALLAALAFAVTIALQVMERLFLNADYPL